MTRASHIFGDCMQARIVAAYVLLLSAHPAVVHGNPPETDKAQAASAYRRVLVPADRPEHWPIDGNQYLPMNRQDFARLIKEANQRRELAKAGPVRITAARHELKLANDFSLQVKSSLDVMALDRTPRVLSLAPWNPTLGAAQWTGPDGQQKSAMIGVWPNADSPPGSVGILVEQSGRLEIDWTVGPPDGLEAELNYRLLLPNALQQELVIELPSDFAVELSSGGVPGKTSIDNGAANRWTFQLRPSSEHRLRIRSPKAEASNRALPRVAVNESYSVSPVGVAYEGAFRVQSVSTEVGELVFRIPHSLKVSEVNVDQAPAEWRTSEAAEGSIAISLPRATLPSDVSVRAVGEAVLGESWQLPKIAVEKAFWTEGTTSLWVDSALEVQDLDATEASLLNTVGVGRGDGGEAYRLQSWASDASIAVLLAEKPPELHVECGLMAEFADSELAGRCQARLWATGGPLLHVEAAIERAWNVESIDAVPADALAAWHVSGEGDKQRLHLQLSRAPTKQNPVEVTITGRKPLRGRATEATVEDMAWVRFIGATEPSSEKLLVADRRGRELFLGAPSTANALLPLESLSPAEQELFRNPTAGLLLATKGLPAGATIRVRPAPPKFQGEARIELARTSTGFQHTAEFLCRPVSGAISEVVVAAARALPSDAQWIIANSGEQPLVQAAWSHDEQRSASKPYEYRIRLANPRSDPFRLIVTWRSEEAPVASINSMSLPGASAWQSWAILRGDPSIVKVEARGLTPAAAEPAVALDGPPVLASLRLGDDPATLLTDSPQLSLNDAVEGRLALGVACNFLDVTTLQFVDGNQIHRLAYELNGARNQTVRIEAPDGVEVVSVRLNGAVVSTPSTEAAPAQMEIGLPGAESNSSLVLDLRVRRAALDARTSIAIAMPRTSFPVLRGRWTVATPAPFLVETVGQQVANVNWRQRLFGPLLDTPRLQLTPDGAQTFSPSSQVMIVPIASSSSVPAGWFSARQEFVTAPAAVKVRRIDSARAARHAAWLFSAVLAAAIWPAARAVIGTICAMLAIACLMLPAAWIALPQAVLLGSIAGIFMREVLAWTARRRPIASPRLATRAASTGAFAAALVIGAQNLVAEEAPPLPPAVLYPIDSEGKPTGQDVYVPVELLAELIPTSGKTRGGGLDHVLVGATFEIKLEEDDAGSGNVSCHECRLRLRLRTFQNDIVVDLPLDKEDGQWSAVPTLLNGTEVPLQWNRSGTKASIAVPKAGAHEFILNLIPRVESTASESQIALRFPSLPGIDVEISHPPSVERLVIDSVQFVPEPQATKTITRKSAGNVFELSWPNRIESSLDDITVDQLSWVHIESAAAHLDVQLRLTGDLAQIQTLALMAPPHLQLLPLPEESPVIQAQARPGLQQTIELKLRAGVTSPLIVPLRFRLQRSMSMGRISFPTVRVRGVDNVKHLVAATVDQRLRLRSQPSAGLAPIATAELEQAWGPLGVAPDAQFAVVPGVEPTWILQLEPAPQQLVARESLELTCGPDHAGVSYRADIDGTQGAIASHRVMLPANMNVSAVSVTVDDEISRIPIRWAQPSSGELMVFLGWPLSQQHELRIDGWVAYDPPERLAIPKIALETTQTAPITVDLYRTSEVLVRTSDFHADANSATPNDMESAIFVGRSRLDRSAQEMPRLELLANKAQFRADAVLTMDLSANTTEPVARLLLHGRVMEGVADRVRLRVASSFQDPSLLESSVAASLTSSTHHPEEESIEIRPKTPLAAGDEFTFRLSGVVPVGNDRRLRVPKLRVENATEQRIFVALPEPPENQTAEWTRRGLKRQRLPKTLADAIDASVIGDTYRVVRQDFIAEQRVFPNSLRDAKVRLAQTQLVIDARGQWSASSSLVVQPGSASSVSVRLPSGSELLQAEINGRRMLAADLRDGQFELPAGSPYLPRLVSLAYRYSPKAKQPSLEFTPPEILVDGRPVDVGIALWQVEGDLNNISTLPKDGVAIDVDDFDIAARRERMDALLDASPLAIQLPEWEAKHWFRPWVWLFATDGVSGARPGQAANWSKLRERISDLVGTVPTSSSQNQFSVRREGSEYFLGGHAGKLALVRTGAGIDAGRWLLALILGVVVLTAWRRPDRLAPALEIVARRPAVVGVVAGIVWWAWLTPKLVGPAIIALSLAAMFKTRRRRRRRERDASVSIQLDGSTSALRPGV